MTTDPRQMTPDELNREAAIGVMGWVPFVDDSDTQTYPCYRVSTITDTVMIARSAYHSFCPWSPATSIADAWELVEKTTFAELHRYVNEETGKVEYIAVASFRPAKEENVDKYQVVVTGAKSAPRAITIAALLAWWAKENSK